MTKIDKLKGRSRECLETMDYNQYRNEFDTPNLRFNLLVERYQRKAHAEEVGAIDRSIDLIG